MKKILIVTWIQYNNYGSLLQAYCLKRMIEGLNNKNNQKIEVQLLNYNSSSSAKSRCLLNKIFDTNTHLIFQKISDRFYKSIASKYIVRMNNAFENFRVNELNLYPDRTIELNAELHDLPSFDLYVAGSDQIWNPKLLDEAYLLDWTPSDKPKISYGPSICVNHLDEEELDKYKCLKTFNALSVREHTEAVEQIEQGIGKKIYEVADPVILYGRDNLLKMCRKYTEDGYVFAYFLGSDKINRNYCLHLAKNNGLKLKTLPFASMRILKNDAKLMKYACRDVGPIEFVNLINNSKLFITDSFHGLIIAILLHKNFVILPRENGDSQQNNRLLKILKAFNLEDYFGKMSDDLDSISSIDWKKIDKKIEIMRKHSREFLENALHDALK